MAVSVEPPRPRAGAQEPSRYPGLTPEERGLEPPSVAVVSPAPEPPPPLWVAPAEVPPADRSVGFVAALPQPTPSEPPDRDGLFDVPGLLERLWLARALEAHRERVGAATTHEAEPSRGHEKPRPSTEGRSGVAPAPAPAVPGPEEREASEVLPPRLVKPWSWSRRPGLPPTLPMGFRPRGWVCPYCYLANDEGATTCRGCRSSTLHL
jgi:hypothetical protein